MKCIRNTIAYTQTLAGIVKRLTTELTT